MTRPPASSSPSPAAGTRPRAKRRRRRFSRAASPRALGLDGIPIHWARQVHGDAAVTVRSRGPARAGGRRRRVRRPRDRPCRALPSSSRRPTASRSSWRLPAPSAPRTPAGAARRRTSPAAARRGPRPPRRRARDAARVDRPFDRPLLLRGRRRGRRAVRRRLRARAAAAAAFGSTCARVNVAQLEAAGVPRAAISVHPACTKCGGDAFASYRRDGTTRRADDRPDCPALAGQFRFPRRRAPKRSIAQHVDAREPDVAAAIVAGHRREKTDAHNRGERMKCTALLVAA